MEQMFRDLIGRVAEEMKDEILARLDAQLEERRQKDATERVAFGEKELAKYLNSNTSTISQWVRGGKFDGCYRKIGKRLFFDLNLIDEKFRK
jgi:hypothetical protein